MNERNKYLDSVYDFLKDDLTSLEIELKNRLLSVSENKVDLHNVFQYFFDVSGKRLRPILVMLSSGLINSQKSNKNKKKLIRLAAAMELIHNSSLIHDDIVDESTHRRGQLTLNYKFNNKIAVLVGDLLYSHAFLIINKLKIPQISGILSECVEEMSKSEINEIISPYNYFNEYIAYLNAKTAELMSVCCKCGAIISKADQLQIIDIGNFGTNFGIAYQLTDDFIDEEKPKNFDINLLLQAKIYAEKAKDNLAGFTDNEFKIQLLNLIHYIIEKPFTAKLEKINIDKNKQKEQSI